MEKSQEIFTKLRAPFGCPEPGPGRPMPSVHRGRADSRPTLAMPSHQRSIGRWALSFFRRAAADNTDTGEVYDDMQNRGLFVIISSRRISKEHLLPLYYSRQQIEQVDFYT